MELRYPIVIVLGIIFLLLIIFIKIKKNKYSRGLKVANTNYLKKTYQFQKLLKKYRYLTLGLKIICLMSMAVTILLIARPIKTNKINYNSYNRDIFLCMDVSSSIDDLNLEIVETLKETVKKLQGERIGISIFNTSSVLLVPLTDDYEYVLENLDKISESISSYKNGNYKDENYFYVTNYILSGTVEDADTRGSSLIGDGLASCVYSFPNIEEKRSRVIIFSTDNDLQGEPIMSLEEAASLSNDYDILVYGLGDNMESSDALEFKEAITNTGGKFYTMNQGDTVESIVKNIFSLDENKNENRVKIIKNDIPTIPFVTLVIFVAILFILNKKVKL